MPELFHALTVKEAREKLSAHIRNTGSSTFVKLLDSLGRRLAADVVSEDNIPGFDRSTVDGYAVRARDTYGASEGLPAYLDVAGEILMGEEARCEIKPGEAWKIATGGMLPPGANAVIMVEYTEMLNEKTIEVVRPVAPGENVVQAGEDVLRGDRLLESGHVIRPQDLGLLAAAGVTKVEVAVPVKVGVISTGDEVVPPEVRPKPGQVRDINSYTLWALVKNDGGYPVSYGVVKDRYESLRDVLKTALSETDMVLISGGSSVGTRDVTARVIDELGEPGVLFHGISIRPGKPAVGAVVDGKAVFGLPGHPASAMVVYGLLVSPLVKNGYHEYELDKLREFPARARITRSIRSAAGREDFIRVKLGVQDGEMIAEPVLGKSGLINTMVKADGLAEIPASCEGVEAGDIVRVKLF